MARRILVVDDDPDIRQVLKDRLESYGYVVETAVNGREALAKLHASAYDGMLLDIMMPDITGKEVLHQLREDKLSVPVVMITATKVNEAAVVALTEGAQGYLLKPFSPEKLKQLADQCFGPGVQ